MPHDYLEPLAQLADQRPVVFYDPSGSGRSDRPSNVSWSLELFSEELSAICTALAVESVHLFSHSMGSLIVLGALVRPMPRLLSVVMASPIIDVPAYLAEVRARVMRMTSDFAAVMRAEEDPQLRKTVAHAQLLYQFAEQHICRCTPRPDALTRSFHALNRAAHAQMKGGSLFYLTPIAELDWSERLSSLSMPTLITCGEDDLATPTACRAFLQRMQHGELAIFPGCTHMPHLEDAPTYVGRLARFLAAADGGASP